MKRVLSLCSAILLLIFISCQKNKEYSNPEADFNFELTDQKAEFALHLSFLNQEMLPLHAGQKEKVIHYFRKTFPNRPFDKIEKMEGLLMRDEVEKKFIVTLVIIGELEEKMKVPLGIEFHSTRISDDELNLFKKRSIQTSSAVTHTCTGNPCTCCIFNYGWNTAGGQQIVGCDCVVGPLAGTYCNGNENSTCNHSISQTMAE